MPHTKVSRGDRQDIEPHGTVNTKYIHMPRYDDTQPIKQTQQHTDAEVIQPAHTRMAALGLTYRQQANNRHVNTDRRHTYCALSSTHIYTLTIQ